MGAWGCRAVPWTNQQALPATWMLSAGVGRAAPDHVATAPRVPSNHLAKAAIVSRPQSRTSPGKPGSELGLSSPPRWERGISVLAGLLGHGRMPSGPRVPATQAKLVSAEASWPHTLCLRSSCWWRRSQGTRWGRSTRRTSSGSSIHTPRTPQRHAPMSQHLL